jgi:hypothetical protein
MLFFFLFISQTNRTIRRIKTDFALDTGKALMQMNSTAAGRRFSWHGTTDTAQKHTQFDSGSTDKIRHLIHEEEEEEGGKREHKRTGAQVSVAGGGGTTNKVASNSMSNILLTKSSFLDRTNSSEGHVQVLTGVKIA